MPLTNAEKQAAWRARQQERMKQLEQTAKEQAAEIERLRSLLNSNATFEPKTGQRAKAKRKS